MSDEIRADVDSREGWNGDEQEAFDICGCCGDEIEDCVCDGGDFDEYDGQPDEYTEWQDYMGGDDWDHGQYDDPNEEY